MGTFTVVYPRYIIPLVPIMAVLAAELLWSLPLRQRAPLAITSAIALSLPGLISSCPKTRTERKARILEAFSKFAETSRRGTGSAIGDPEQTSPPDHPLRPACAPELLCGVAVVITEQAAQSFTTLHIPRRDCPRARPL